MLFSRMVDPSCSYCAYGTSIGDGEIACTKRGITTEGGCCRKFRYDPLKRVPERPQIPEKSLMPPELAAQLHAELGIEPSAEQIVETAATEIPDADQADDGSPAEPCLNDATN